MPIPPDRASPAVKRKRSVPISGRISSEERAALERLAHHHDRSPSREIRRAIRFYIGHYELAEQVLDAAPVSAHRVTGAAGCRPPVLDAQEGAERTAG